MSTKPTSRSRAHAQRMAALAKTGSAGSYQPQVPIPLYPTPVFPPPALSAPPPCVFLGCGPKPKSKKDKARLEPNILHRAARKPWAQWSPRQRSELTLVSNHVFWLVTEAHMTDIRKDLLPVCPKNVERIGLKPFHVAVLAGHLEVVRARPRRRNGASMASRPRAAPSTRDCSIDAGVHRAQPAARRELPRVPRGDDEKCEHSFHRDRARRAGRPPGRVSVLGGAAEWFRGACAWEEAAFV